MSINLVLTHREVLELESALLDYIDRFKFQEDGNLDLFEDRLTTLSDLRLKLTSALEHNL